MTIPSTTDNYTVDMYYQYLFTKIMEDKTHQTAYFNKHRLANPNLTMELIDEFYDVLK